MAIRKVPSARRISYLALVCAAALLLGMFVMKAMDAKKQERLQALGIENFNDAQLKTWQECQSIQAALGRVYEKVQEYDGFSSENWHRGWQFIMPGSCQALKGMAADNFAERMHRERK